MSRAPSDWITLTEAVEILATANVHIGAGTLGRWARDGRLQTIKLGGRRYVRRGEVRALLRPRRRIEAGPAQHGLFEEL